MSEYFVIVAYVVLSLSTFLNWIWWRFVMATLEEVNANVAELSAVIAGTDAKLDEIRAFILSLQAGSVVTQEQLDQLAASIEAAKSGAQAVLAEADALDEA